MKMRPGYPDPKNLPPERNLVVVAVLELDDGSEDIMMVDLDWDGPDDDEPHEAVA